MLIFWQFLFFCLNLIFGLIVLELLATLINLTD